jgi:hypothetical protein
MLLGLMMGLVLFSLPLVAFAQDGFSPVTDPVAKEALIQEMWQTLTVPNCWDASFVGDPAVGGTPAAVAQLSFFDPFQYRYVSSTDVFLGVLSLFNIGYYYGYPTAIVSTWTGETEGIVILDASQFVHVLTNPEGAVFTVTYTATDEPCL